MNTVDRENILNGTAQKRFTNERAALASDYTKTNAQGFYYFYVDKPLSFILKNSRDIFSESYFGSSFYFSLLRKALINPEDYLIELDKVDAYIEEAEKRRLSDNQVGIMYDIRSFLNEKVKAYKNLGFVFRLASARGAKAFFDEAFDMIYEAEQASTKEEKQYWLMAAGSAIFQGENPYPVLPVGFLLASKYPVFEKMLYQFIFFYTS